VPINSVVWDHSSDSIGRYLVSGGSNSETHISKVIIFSYPQNKPGEINYASDESKPVVSAVFSKDGRKIAYITEYEGEQEEVLIHIVDI